MLASVLDRVIQGRQPVDVLALQPKFLAEVDVGQELSPTHNRLVELRQRDLPSTSPDPP